MNSLGINNYVKFEDLINPALRKFDDRYHHMIDGRTIFQYMVFVEPELAKIFPKSLRTNAKENLGECYNLSFSPFKFIRKEDVKSIENAQTLKLHSERYFSPCQFEFVALDEEYNLLESIQKVETAITLIDKTNLLYLFEFSIGRIIYSYSEIPSLDVIGIASLDLTKNIYDISIDLLSQCAKSFIAFFIMCELNLRNEKYDNEKYNYLIEIFIESVIYEFKRRYLHKNDKLEFNLPDQKSRFAKISSYSKIPLTQELCAYWFYGWNRSQVIMETPFDYMSSLNI